MAAIGVNTIRVYWTEPTENHDGCMQAFASQGIYAWIDLTSPLYAIDRTDPNYTEELFNRWSSVIDAFSQYNNTLSFTAANELINDAETVSVAPYIRAIVRDLKAFRDARGYRKIPISYTAGDFTDLLLPTKDYLSCGDQDNAIELYGINQYSWCGNSSYTQSGYDKVYTQFQDISIPALFAETGCNNPSPRTFGEVAAVLGSVFPATFSGVIVYEWPEEGNDYGLVDYSNNNDTGFPSTLADYYNLGKVYTTASPVSTALTDYTPTNSPPSCPTSNSNWPLAGSASLPTVKALNIDTVTARTTYYSSGGPTDTAAAAVSATGTDSGSAGSSSDTSDPQAQTGLSTGAIAGIAIAGGAIGIAAAVLAFFLLRRRRNQPKRDLDDTAAGSYGAVNGEDADRFNKAELPAAAVNAFAGKQELQSNQLYEAGAGAPNVHEMDPAGGKNVYHEMAGSRPNTTELEGSHAARQVE